MGRKMYVKLYLRDGKITPVRTYRKVEHSVLITKELFKVGSEDDILDYLEKTGQEKIVLKEKPIRLGVYE